MCRLRPLILLPGVVAAAGPCDLLGGFDRLGVDDRRRRRGLAPGHLADAVAQPAVHGLGGPVGLPFGGPVINGPGGREVGGQRPPHRPVVRQVADAVDDVAHAVARGAAALACQPCRVRQQRLADRPLGVAHVRGVAGPAPAAADPAGTAPAGHGRGLISGGSPGLDSGRRSTVQRHARLLASRWIRHPCDYQEPLLSQRQHAGRATGRSRNVTTYGLRPVFKQALSECLENRCPGGLS